MESSLFTKHEDRIAGEGFTSMTQNNLVHKFIENSGRESCGGQGMEKTRGRFFWKHKRDKKKVRYIDGHLSSQNAELEPKFQKYKGRVVLRGDIVKDDSGSYCSLFLNRSLYPSQMGGRSHIAQNSQSDRVALDWLCDRINVRSTKFKSLERDDRRYLRPLQLQGNLYGQRLQGQSFKI